MWGGELWTHCGKISNNVDLFSKKLPLYGWLDSTVNINFNFAISFQAYTSCPSSCCSREGFCGFSYQSCSSVEGTTRVKRGRYWLHYSNTTNNTNRSKKKPSNNYKPCLPPYGVYATWLLAGCVYMLNCLCVGSPTLGGDNTTQIGHLQTTPYK